MPTARPTSPLQPLAPRESEQPQSAVSSSAFGFSGDGDPLIDRLPSELLVTIFELVLFHRMMSCEEAEDFPRPRPLAIANSVCTRWREFINGTPFLWRYVVVDRGSEWLRICLNRSRDVPLNILFLRGTVFVQSSSLLFALSRRIRTLVLCDTTQNALRLVDMLIAAPLPALEDLRINAARCEEACARYGDTLGACPSLRAVYLDSAHLDWQSPAVRQLRSIKLLNWQHRDQNITLAAFLRCLESCPNLEDLYFDFALPVFDCASQPAPVVSLPRLRSLSLVCASSGPRPDVFYVLSHIRLPLTADIEVYAQVTAENAHEIIPMDFTQHIPCDPTCLPILLAATSAVLRPYFFQCAADARGSLEVNLDYVGQIDRDIKHDGYIKDFCRLLTKAPLTHLRVENLSVARELWLLLFKTFPTLTKLTVYALGSRNSNSRVSAVPALEALGEDLIPNLRVLTVLQERDQPDLLDAISSVLRRRAARGNAPLDELKIEMGQDDEGRELLCQTLRPLVNGRITYQKFQFRDLRSPGQRDAA
ncbi:hypothetical protein C8Q79DRAFT_174744 [Trametes meyenii]|nr:hypothetical protein C8Q79DRAFT_174744 [Trametes meyenii]